MCRFILLLSPAQANWGMILCASPDISNIVLIIVSSIAEPSASARVPQSEMLSPISLAFDWHTTI